MTSLWWAINMMEIPPQRAVSPEALIILITVIWMAVISFFIRREVKRKPPDWWDEDNDS